LHETYSDRSKPNDAIRTLAAEAAPPTLSEADRIAALVRVARDRVKRIDVDTATEEERREARANKNAADAVKRRLDTADDQLVVFLALAAAAWLDARVAAVPNRSSQFHKAGLENPFFVRWRLAAIHTATGWTFVDIGNEHSPTGGLRWYFEWQEALIADPRQVTTMRTSLSNSSTSVKRRTATLTLNEDGTLEGECRLEYTGHWAETLREDEDQDAPAEREKSLRDLMVKRLPGAELSAIAFEHAADPQRPYVNTYRVRVPSYAQRTGSRLFLQPSFFSKGIDTLFAADSRSSNIYFPFPWSEQDVVTIELPPGFVLEQPEAPASFDAGAGKYHVAISSGDGWKRLTLNRTMSFGLGDQLLFPQSAYSAVKRFFDAVHMADSHTLVLRPAAAK
jgi:hypothetical protein